MDLTSKGVGRYLFVLGTGHQQHPKEAPSRGERRSRVKVGMSSSPSPLLAQAAPCGAPEGTGPYQPRGIGILVASKEGTTMVFSLRARPRPRLHNYRKEETDGGGSGQASKCKNRHSLADQVCELTGLKMSR